LGIAQSWTARKTNLETVRCVEMGDYLGNVHRILQSDSGGHLPIDRHMMTSLRNLDLVGERDAPGAIRGSEVRPAPCEARRCWRSGNPRDR